MGVKNNNELYKDLTSRVDTILGETLYELTRLSRAHREFINEKQLSARAEIPLESFDKWLTERWGVKIKNANPGITGYTVVDEKKYLLFCLKFGVPD